MALVLLFILVGEMNENSDYYPKKHHFVELLPSGYVPEFVPDVECDSSESEVCGRAKLIELEYNVPPGSVTYGGTMGYLRNPAPAPPPTRKVAEGYGMWDHDVFWQVSPAMHRVRSE